MSIFVMYKVLRKGPLEVSFTHPSNKQLVNYISAPKKILKIFFFFNLHGFFLDHLSDLEDLPETSCIIERSIKKKLLFLTYRDFSKHREKYLPQNGVSRIIFFYFVNFSDSHYMSFLDLI